MLDFARSLADEAAQILREAHGRLNERTVEVKGRRDLVTDVDRRIEELLARRIERGLSRRCDPRRRGCAPRRELRARLGDRPARRHDELRPWASDGLREPRARRGLRGPSRRGGGVRLPAPRGFFAPGELPRVRLGVVAAPVLGEVFWGELGAGAFVNGRRLCVSATADLADSLVATGFAYRMNELRNSNLDNFCRLALRARGVRRGGSAALDLCYVASGRFDAFWEPYLKPWDVAAAMLFVREAGGRVTDFGGGDRALEGVEVLASNSVLHDAVRELLDPVDPFWARSERERLLGGAG